MNRQARSSSSRHDRRRHSGGRLAIVIVAICLAPCAAAFGQAAADGGISAVASAATAATARPDPLGVPTKVSLGFYVVDIETVEDLKQESRLRTGSRSCALTTNEPQRRRRTNPDRLPGRSA